MDIFLTSAGRLIDEHFIKSRSGRIWPQSSRGRMSFETISLLLNWLQLGALLAIMFRLAHTFDLIANTQRELRRAIHHLGERRAAELGFDDAYAGSKSASPARLPQVRARKRIFN
jgi:hypothetical protein